MRATVAALALAWLAGVSTARAQGLEYGPRIAFSTPTQDVAEALVPGVSYGLTGTLLESHRRGFGVDVVYHRWAGTPEVSRSLDEFLSAISGEPIAGSRITVSALQATMHAKVFVLERGPVLPWMKVGVGVYRLNWKLELPIASLQAAGFRLSASEPDQITHEIGFNFGAGLDLEITPDTKLGLEATYHLLATRDPKFTAFTIGACWLTGPP